MRPLSWSLIFFYFSSCFFPASGQSLEQLTVYNDPVLLNGKVYIFHPPNGTEGNQYLAGTEFVPGTIALKGFIYTGLLLNYDVYNQQLILKYKSSTGAENRIIVSDAWIEQFKMNDLCFRVFRNKNGRSIFQVLGDGKYQVFYHWTKKLELSQFHGSSQWVFSKPRRTMYLFHDNMIFEFRNNKGFIALFDRSEGEKILDYLHRNKTNLRNAAASRVTELVSFANASAQ